MQAVYEQWIDSENGLRREVVDPINRESALELNRLALKPPKYRRTLMVTTFGPRARDTSFLRLHLNKSFDFLGSVGATWRSLPRSRSAALHALSRCGRYIPQDFKMSGFLSLMGWTFLPDVSSPSPLSATFSTTSLDR